MDILQITLLSSPFTLQGDVANGIFFAAVAYQHPGWHVATGCAPGFVQATYTTGG